MDRMRGLLGWIRTFLHRAEFEHEVRDELDHHIELATQQKIDAGMDRLAARREALRDFGGVERTREQVREAGTLFTLETMVRDLRFALRSLSRQPVFTAVAILTLALGIGATTSIFSALNEVMLRPIDARDPEDLVMLWERNEERGWDKVQVAPANFLDWRDRVDAFEDAAFYSEFTDELAIEVPGGARQILVASVGGNFFSVLGRQQALGRTFTFEETWDDSAPVVILSNAAWLRFFDGAPDALGQTLHMDGLPYTVIGVMPEGYRYPFVEEGSRVDAWKTLRWSRGLIGGTWFRQAHLLRAVARLAPGVPRARALAQLQDVAAQLQEEHPSLNEGMEAGFTRLQTFLVGDRARTLYLLMGAVAVLLLIASANVANLMIVRAQRRQRELAIRGALGASRGRILRHVLGEGFALAFLGGIAGIGVGYAGLRGVAALGPPGFPDLAFHLDIRLLFFALGVTCLSALLFGIVPAMRGARLDPRTVFSEGSRTASQGRSGHRTAHLIIASEIALALVLVVGAGLMVRSLGALNRQDAGIVPDHVLTFELTPASGTYPTDPDRALLIERVVQRLQALPGVTAAGVTRRLPLTSMGWSSDFTVEGWGPDRFGIEVRHNAATSGYFAALGIPVLAGEVFADRKSPDDPSPVVVNETFLERYFPGGESPVGRRMVFDRVPTERSSWYTIVGVVGDVRMQSGQDPVPEIIGPLWTDVPGTPRFVMKTAVSPLSLSDAVTDLVAALDPGLPVARILTMKEVIQGSRSRERFIFILLTAFATIALLLAAVGVYGVSAQVTRGRLREIGIQVALGASESRIILGMLKGEAAAILGGVTVGIVGALFATRALGRLLYGVASDDPLTFALVALLLTVVSAGASYFPARRACRTDPVGILRLD